MPLQNRVDPCGRIESNRSRGTIMGNRGKLHDAHRRLSRTSTRLNWIYCHLNFRGRHREVMHPRSYTELFFLDEPTALAAGHRPCAECRHPEYVRFQNAWARANGGTSRPKAIELDTSLAAARRTEDGTQRVHRAASGSLPNGTMIFWRDAQWLVNGARVHRWSFDGYVAHLPRTALPSEVDVCTPLDTVRVLNNGFEARPHFSCVAFSRTSG